MNWKRRRKTRLNEWLVTGLRVTDKLLVITLIKYSPRGQDNIVLTVNSSVQWCNDLYHCVYFAPFFWEVDGFPNDILVFIWAHWTLFSKIQANSDKDTCSDCYQWPSELAWPLSRSSVLELELLFYSTLKVRVPGNKLEFVLFSERTLLVLRTSVSNLWSFSRNLWETNFFLISVTSQIHHLIRIDQN